MEKEGKPDIEADQVRNSELDAARCFSFGTLLGRWVAAAGSGSEQLKLPMADAEHGFFTMSPSRIAAAK